MSKAAKHRLVFLAVGTSGAVCAAAGLVDHPRRHGAEPWLVNTDAADNGARFEHFVRGISAEVLPAIFNGDDTSAGFRGGR